MSADVEPRTSLRRNYEQCLKARRQWMSVRGRTAQEDHREQAHADLHEATLAWFEALVPYISERPGEVKQLWESAPLWPERPKREIRDVLACTNEDCEAVWADEEDGALEAQGGCPACWSGALAAEEKQVPVRDEEGRPLWEWACGLKRLASWTNKTETVSRSGGKWKNEQTTVEVPKRLEPDILLRAARFLDLAAEECGLLEDTDRALPTGEL